jgi:hypothetical protein
MATKYVESGEQYRARQTACRMLGVDSFWLGLVMKEYPKRGKGIYAMPDSNQRAEVAREVYKRHESETDAMLELYETKLAKIQKRKEDVAGRVSSAKECRVCGKSNPGKFDACPVCLDVYIHEFRDDFLKHLNSCDALKILDS